MRAVVSDQPGGPETLRVTDGFEIPHPGPGEVRVRVRAASLNFPDLLRIEDKYQQRVARPFVPGSEAAGEIDALGEGVTGIAVGSRVMAMTEIGALAEYVCVPAHRATAIPDDMPFDEAAALMVTYGTSWHALTKRADLKADETLLVLAASGGVGLAAVEIGKALGARVIAAVSTPEKGDVASAAGADAVVIYPSGPLDMAAQKEMSQSFKAAVGPEGASVVFDPVGGDYAIPAFRAIGWDGRYLVVGFAAGIADMPMNLPLLKGASVLGVFWGASVERDPEGHRAAMTDLLSLYSAGDIRPRIHGRWPLDEAPRAMTLLGGRGAIGKLVIEVAQV